MMSQKRVDESIHKTIASPLRGSADVVSLRPYTPIGGVGSLDEAFVCVLSDVLNAGQFMVAGQSMSTGSGRDTKEILNYSIALSAARQRLLYNPIRQINLLGALGRFVWMMSGSDRVADIEYYEPKILGFSDDGITVPGSNYGTRLFQPRPGLNQISNVIETLKRDRTSRRGSAVIYQPEDSGRESRDIPCAFGLFFNIRDDSLHLSVVMRSNNAWTLFPYNVFEFSLIAELVAAEVGVQFGSYHHFAVSMHVYQSDFADAANAVKADISSVPKHKFPEMPRAHVRKSLEQLLKYEIKVRSNFTSLNGRNYKGYLREAEDIGEYWGQFAKLLLIQGLRKAHKTDYSLQVGDTVDEPFIGYLKNYHGPLFERS